MTNGINRTKLFCCLIGLLLESASAMATGTNINRLLQVRARTSRNFGPIGIGPEPAIPARSHRSSQSAITSQLFSSGAAAAAVGTMGSIAVTPLKRSILAIRGGSAGLAITGFVKKIMDEVAASKTKSWAALVTAILLETVAATLSKKARDTASPGLFALAVSLNLLSMSAFCASLAKLDIGVAYAVWAALGTIIVTTAGILFFHETCDPIKLTSISFVILGVVGLNLRG